MNVRLCWNQKPENDLFCFGTIPPPGRMQSIRPYSPLTNGPEGDTTNEIYSNFSLPATREGKAQKAKIFGPGLGQDELTIKIKLIKGASECKPSAPHSH